MSSSARKVVSSKATWSILLISLAFAYPTLAGASEPDQLLSRSLDEGESEAVGMFDQHAYLFPSTSESSREGVVRVINHSWKAGEFTIVPVDDSGQRFDSLQLSIGPGESVQLNADDLESGNEAKGLSGQTGAWQGNWRLAFASDLDFEVLSYLHTVGGSLSSMHNVVPREGDVHRVLAFNPASDQSQASRLRLVNFDSEAATIAIRGTDDLGASAIGEVSFTLDAGNAREITAVQLESGTSDIQGSLGDRTGMWRLEVQSERSIVVMNLVESSMGQLTNLSTVPTAPIDGVHTVPLFPPIDRSGPHGFLRLINRSTRSGEVNIQACDASSCEFDELTLTINANRVVHLTADDIEHGASDKGLSGRTGAGAGNWLLKLTSELDIDVLSYLRTDDGFLTALHDRVPESARRYRVAMFASSDNQERRSLLFVANPSELQAHVEVVGIDDDGDMSSGTARFLVPAKSARFLEAEALEAGSTNVQGSIGDGVDTWRLTLSSDRPIIVLNLLFSLSGRYTNLSTAPHHGPGPPESATEAFEAIVTQIVASKCATCHVPDGEAGDTRLLFVPPTDPDYVTTNFDVVRSYVLSDNQEHDTESSTIANLILDKISATVSHGGGEQAARDSTDFREIASFLDLMLDEAGRARKRDGVSTLPAGKLILKTANPFDLNGKTLSFTPDDNGSYDVTVDELDWIEPGFGADSSSHPMWNWSTFADLTLPFDFSFAGQSWSRIYVNAGGNISFQRPELNNWPQRDPWADATMRSVAAAIDSRAAAGLEYMIAALWANYEDSRVQIDSSPEIVAVTWRAVRPNERIFGLKPLGESQFQARLYPSGKIVLAYRNVPERNGIVGVFHGLDFTGQVLDTFDALREMYPRECWTFRGSSGWTKGVSYPRV